FESSRNGGNRIGLGHLRCRPYPTMFTGTIRFRILAFGRKNEPFFHLLCFLFFLLFCYCCRVQGIIPFPFFYFFLGLVHIFKKQVLKNTVRILKPTKNGLTLVSRKIGLILEKIGV